MSPDPKMIGYHLLDGSPQSKLFAVPKASGGHAWRGLPSRGCALATAVATSLALNVVFLARPLHAAYPAETMQAPSPLEFPQVLYTPAQSTLQHAPLMGDPALDRQSSIYDQTPSEEVDAAWKNLYKHATSRIPHTQAALLQNKTYPIEGDDGYHIIALDVFHQLHCLNAIRKALNPEYYPSSTPEEAKKRGRHVRHCLAIVRQALMCLADATPLIFQWDEKFGGALTRMDVLHSCRDFDAVQRWAEENRVIHEPDLRYYIEDDLYSSAP